MVSLCTLGQKMLSTLIGLSNDNELLVKFCLLFLLTRQSGHFLNLMDHFCVHFQIDVFSVGAFRQKRFRLLNKRILAISYYLRRTLEFMAVASHTWELFVPFAARLLGLHRAFCGRKHLIIAYFLGYFSLKQKLDFALGMIFFQTWDMVRDGILAVGIVVLKLNTLFRMAALGIIWILFAKKDAFYQLAEVNNTLSCFFESKLHRHFFGRAQIQFAGAEQWKIFDAEKSVAARFP
jgi:hypothetical protein